MNTEAPEGVSGGVTAAADFNRGNTDLFVLSVSPIVRYRAKDEFVAAIVRTEYGHNDDERILFRAFTHIRYRHRFSERWLGEAFTQHEFDEFRRLNLRSLVGFGPKYELLRRQDANLGLGVAYMLEYEELDNDGNERDAGDDHLDHRLSSYLSGRLAPTERVELFQTFYAQPRFDRPSDIRLLSQSEASVKASETIAITTSLNIAYDSRPPDTIKKTDITLKSSISWSF